MSVEVSAAVVGNGRRTAEDRSPFFFWMSVVFFAIACAGFARSYLIPVATSGFEGSAFLHVHGALFFGWTLLLVVQTRLVARRRIELHRALGLAGISLATGMVFTAVGLIVRALNSPGIAADPTLFGALAALPLTQITLFAAFFAAAIANARTPESHKRWMLLATANLMGAPVARIIGIVIAPESGSIATLPDVSARLTAAIGGMVAIDLIVAAAILYDRRVLGRLHRVYAIGLGTMLLTQVLRIPLAQTALWHSIAKAFATLGS